jgi:hypothetical protein
MPCHNTVFGFLDYSLEKVEAAMKRGEKPVFEDAAPTEYDAFFSVGQELGVLDSFKELVDPRQSPYVPLEALCVLVMCRFLHCLQSFARTGEVLLRYHPLLLRLGFAPVVLKRGVYRSKRTRQLRPEGEAQKAFDEECFSEVLRGLSFEALNKILVAYIQRLRKQHGELFRRGLFIMDSNHYTLRGSGQEYKWCALMLWTPKGMIPVWMEFSPVPGDGETTIGRRVLERALAAYGDAFLKHLLIDSGYVDGETLHWLKFEKGADWTTKAREGMQAIGWMRSQMVDQPHWRWQRVDPPKLNCAKKKLPTRRILWLENNPFPTYGAKVNGIVIWDHYLPDEGHPEERNEYQHIVTSRLDWKGGQIHSHWRMRWCIENAFGAMTERWGLGKWQNENPEVYRATVQLMALTYGLLVFYLICKDRPASLQRMADRFQAQAARMILVRVGGACALLTSEILNDWLARGIITIHLGGP